MRGYGKELIIDLHKSDPSTFRRLSISEYLRELCDDVIDMEREDLHFWDYEGDPEGYAAAPDHLKGVSCVQFISTSNIVIHTVDPHRKVFINIFTCKDFDAERAVTFTEEWFRGRSAQTAVLDRL